MPKTQSLQGVDRSNDIEKTEDNKQHRYRKIIVTGHVVEVYEMEHEPYQVERRSQGAYKSEVEWIQEFEEEMNSRSLVDKLTAARSFAESHRIMAQHMGREQRNITRTRNMVRRLGIANFSENSRFVTFTFKENITSIAAANVEWKKFIMRMRYKYGVFKYLAVIEFQKRGAVHYHCIWDLPYIPKRDIQEVWGQGFVKVNKIDHVDNVGAYIVKYMTKDLFDERFVAQKAYQCSKGLERPQIIPPELQDEIAQMYGLDKIKAVFESSYTSEYLGEITYKEYNLKRV